MAATDIWFPFYVGDYLADTMHLDTTKHGAYLLLLMAYYKNRGPLEDNNAALAEITRQTVTDWRRIRSAMAKFFLVQDGVWRHLRADREIAKRSNAQNARINAAHVTNQRLGRLSPPATGEGRHTVTDTLTVPVGDTVNGRTPYRRKVANPQSQSQPQIHNQNGEGIPPVLRTISTSERITAEKELKRVEDAMGKIKNGYDAHSTWTGDDRRKFNELKQRRAELLQILGMKV